MFIDASALTAAVAGEPDAAELLARLQQRRIRLTSPLAIWEAAVAVARILDLPVRESGEAVREFTDLMGIETVAIPPGVETLALDAFGRYGKGRHPAGLNFGDCFAYACARHFGQPLMYKGADFALTDIESA